MVFEWNCLGLCFGLLLISCEIFLGLNLLVYKMEIRIVVILWVLVNKIIYMGFIGVFSI